MKFSLEDKEVVKFNKTKQTLLLKEIAKDISYSRTDHWQSEQTDVDLCDKILPSSSRWDVIIHNVNVLINR